MQCEPGFTNAQTLQQRKLRGSYKSVDSKCSLLGPEIGLTFEANQRYRLVVHMFLL